MKYRDFEEFIESLNTGGAKYLIVGAHAVAFHARPRATKDLDLFIEPSQPNACRVQRALRSFFGGADLGYSVDDLTNPDLVLQIGVAPVRIDLMMELAGIGGFAAAWGRRVEAPFGDAPAHYLSLDDLVAAKTAAGRPQDRADLVSLRRAQARRRPGSPRRR